LVAAEALLRRESKATFDEVFRRDESRRFAEHWDGANVDTEIVDPEALQRSG
jgi:predicted SnoaL-like aldol condensation-catalyzing enzyme